MLKKSNKLVHVDISYYVFHTVEDSSTCSWRRGRAALSGCRRAVLARVVSGAARLCTVCVCAAVAHETIICRYAVTVNINTFQCLCVYLSECEQMMSS
jgi:hypothetical protein